MNAAYATNMIWFIHDLRRDLGVPDLPFVIAATGQGGPEETHPRALSPIRAQAAAAAHFGPTGRVAFVDTRPFWRPAEVLPNRQNYHWNGNAETFHQIGVAIGEAMLSLLSAPSGRAAARPARP